MSGGLQLGGVIFPGKDLEDALRLAGRVDGKKGTDKDDGWEELCNDMGWDRWKQRLCRERYEDGWYEGAIQQQQAA